MRKPIFSRGRSVNVKGFCSARAARLVFLRDGCDDRRDVQRADSIQGDFQRPFVAQPAHAGVLVARGRQPEAGITHGAGDGFSQIFLFVHKITLG